jgi:hypothetical protein
VVNDYNRTGREQDVNTEPPKQADDTEDPERMLYVLRAIAQNSRYPGYRMSRDQLLTFYEHVKGTVAPWAKKDPTE